MHKALPLCFVLLSLLTVTPAAQAQTYTAPGNFNFTNPNAWNFGAGSPFGIWSIPVSDSGLALNFQSFGSASPTATNDLNLTLKTLNITANSSGNLILASSANGDYAFTGAAKINLFGSGSPIALSAPIVFGSGLTSLTLDGAGSSNLAITSVITSNTSTGAPLTLATDARNSNTAVVSLNTANSFAGGVVLNSGTLNIGNANALGDIANTLTVNGGNFRAGSGQVIANNVTLSSSLNINSVNGFTLGGVLSGAGGLNARPSAVVALSLTGANTYLGATTVESSNFALGPVDGAGALTLSGAMGSIMNTSGITVRDGASLNLRYDASASASNTRVSTSTAITTQSAFLQVLGNSGLVQQSLGTVNAGGLTTVLAQNTGLSPSGTELTIANLARGSGATVVFQGLNLGALAVGSASLHSNVVLTKIDNATPSTALVGGGGAAGSATVSILPWALGESSNTANNYAAGSTFVTYGPDGVRLLDTTTEYNTSNSFTGLADDFQNMRVSASASVSAPTKVNSLFFGTTGATISGVGPLTITSGALASNVAAATISAPVNFGASGAGEGIISVVDALAGTTNNLILSGGLTAASLTKSGHGDLTISTTNPTISGGININGGEIKVDSVPRLGGATGITVNGSSQAANRAGLVFTHTSGTQTLTTPITVNAGTASISTTGPSGAILEVNSVISGRGGVTYSNANSSVTIAVGGANTYTGPTFIGGSGNVQFDGNDSRFGSNTDPNASFLNMSGGTLLITGDWTSGRAINFSGAISLQSNFNTTLSGPITGNASVAKNGTGTLTFDTGTGSLTGLDSSYSGNFTVNAGTLKITNNGALNAASITLANSAALDFSGALNIDPTTTGNPWRSVSALAGTATNTISLGATVSTPVDLRVASSSAAVASVISGFGNLVKVDTTTLTLSGTNTFTGGVEIWGGSLAFSADNQLGNSSNGISIKGGILNSTATLSTSRGMTLGATPQVVVGATLNNGINTAALTTLTLNGAITGSGGFNKSGTGTLTLTTASDYAGDTQITGGSVVFSNNNQLGGATSRLRLNGGTLSDSATAGTQTLNRAVFTTANSTIDVSATGGTLELAGPIIGSNTITKTGAGALTISGNNSSFFGALSMGPAGGTPGAVTLASTGQMRRANVVFANVTSGKFDMSGLNREFGNLSLFGNSELALGNGGQVTTGFSNGTVSIGSGKISGNNTASFTKVGTGVVQISNDTSTFSGGFHAFSGNVTSLGAFGAIPAQSAFTLGAWGNNANRGPVLLLDSSSLANSSNARIADAQVIHSNAGEIQLSTNTTNAVSETIGSLRGAGMTTVTMTTGGTLNFGDSTNGLKRINNGTFLFRSGGTSAMGSGSPTVNLANLTFGNLGAGNLIGGGGGAGTTSISILPYAVGGTFVTSAGSNFVTYGANGVRVLNETTENINQVNVASIPGASSADNVRFANTALTTTQITGGTDLTINALALTPNSGNNTRIESSAGEKIVLSSGLVISTQFQVFTTNAAGTQGIPLGIQTAEIQTGAGNSRELIVHTSSSDLALGAKVTTSGGLTKSGDGNLFLTNNANTYTGATTINAGSLVVNSLGALGGSTNTLQIGGGFLKYRGADATLTQSVVAAGGESSNQNGGSAGFHVVSGTTLTAKDSGISGYGGILKDGTGVLKLTGTNTNTGATIINGGTLAIDGAAALGTNNRIVFGTGLSTNGGQVLRFDANNITLTQDFITNTADATIGLGFDTNGNNATLSGTILSTTSTRGLYKFGAGNLTLTANEMFTGATQIFGGSLTLSGADGSIMNSSGTGGFTNSASVLIAPRTSLVLDNSTANNNNRLPDVWDSPFGSGNAANGALRLSNGEFKIIGNATSGTQEKINQFIVSLGTITLQGGGTQLVSGAFSITSVASAGLIRGTNLGGTPGSTSTNWFLTDLGGGAWGSNSPFGGAGGTEGTPFVNTVRGFMSDTSATGLGTDLTTYAADTGFRPLTSSEYTSTIPANNFYVSRAPNVALTGAATINQTTGIAALKLSTGASLGGSGTVNIGNSTILATGNASISVPALNSAITGANAAIDFLTPGASTTLTVDSVLVTPRVAKVGDGTLVIKGRHIGGSFVTISEGTVKVDGAQASLNPLIPLILVGTGTFDLGGSDRVVGDIVDDSNITAGTFYSGQRASGTVALGANRLTLYDANASLYSGSITGTGGLTKAIFSSATTTFTQPIAYTGSTVVRGGTLQLASAGTLASTSIDLRGGNLLFNNSDDSAATGGYIPNRISTTAPITVAGSTITFTENVNTPASHNLGALTLAGAGTLTISQTSVTAPSTTTIADLVRGDAVTSGVKSNTGTLTIVAPNLGLAQSPTGNARIFATKINGDTPANALIGGGGAVGSTTQSILPWAWSTTATSFLTYGTDGFRPLATGEYELDLLNSPSSAAVNSRIATAQTLTAARTVNSLVVNSTGVSGAFDLTLTSGALAVTLGSSTVGVATNALLTGAGNTRELVINTTANSSLGYNVTTSGGVTKFGTGTLTLGSSNNTFTGGLTINEGTVSFTNNNQLGAAGGMVRFGGLGVVSGTTGSILQYTGTSALVFDRPMETTGLGTLAIPTGVRLLQNQPISGTGGFRFRSSTAGGIYEVNAVNTYTGPTVWGFGHLYINGDSAFGNGGELILNAAATEAIVLRNHWATSRLIHTTSSSIIQTNGFDATWNGQLIGASAVAKNGTGNLILTEAMPYSGTLTTNAGSLVLKDRGSLAVATLVANVNGSVTLDDRSTHFSDRTSDTGTLSLGAGNLNLLGNASTTTEEVINTLALATGANTVTITPGTGQAAILRLASSVTNAGGAATLFRGTNLGVNAPGTANSASIVLTEVAKQTANAFAVTGGGAPAGNPSISVIKGAFGDTSSTGLGTQLVTYDLDKGVRLLDPATEYTGTIVDGSVVTDNIKADGTAKNLTATLTIANALWLKDGGSITGGGALGLSSGSLLVTGTGNSITGIINTTPNALAIGGPGDLTFNTTNGIVTSGGLSKMGAGTLTLTQANAFTGNTWLHSGTIAIGNAAALGTSGVRFFDGELRNSSAGALSVTNNITIDGVMRIGGAQDLTLSGTLNINNATREINITNTGVTTLSGVISSSVANVNYGLTKTGPGLLVLSANNTYDGPTTVNGGELRTGNLNIAFGKGTVTVNSGGTIAGTGLIAPLLGLESLNTITINSGGTLRAGNGTGTGLLSLGSSVTAGVTSATVALAAGSILDFRYSTAPGTAAINTGGSTAAGTNSNLVSIVGGLTVDLNALFSLTGTFSDFTAGQSYSFKLAQDTTTLLDSVNITSFSNFVVSGVTGWTTGTFNLAVNGVGNNLYLNLSPNLGTPTVARNLAIATITTGTASNTGTFSDSDGNTTVTLTAKKGGLPFGTITRNTGAGTWSWSATGLTNADAGTVTVEATDSSGLVSSTTFAVAPPNTAPTITSNGGGATATISVAENTSAVTTVIATDTDLPAQTITYSKSGPDAALFNIDSGTGVLTFAAAPDFETGPGPFSVTVTATDDGTPSTLSDSQDLTVNVTNVNEMPSFTKGADETKPPGTNNVQIVSGWATAIDDGDSTVTQALTFNITGNTNAGMFLSAPTIDSAGTLTYRPNGTGGTATISVTLTDDASINGTAALTTAVQTFTITVQAAPDYTVTTTGNAIVVTDSSGNGDTLTVSEPSAGNIRFAAAGRTFSVNGGAYISGNSGDLSRTSVTSITVNGQGGNDTITVNGFTGTLPSLTINGGTGDDSVNLNGDITFTANSNLDVDLQNDDPTPGTDRVTVGTNANLITSGTGSLTIKCSRNVLANTGSSLEVTDGALVLEANQQAVPTAAGFVGVQVNGLVQSHGIGNLTIKGRGGDIAGADFEHGVQVFGTVRGGTAGTVLVEGTGAPSVGTDNYGVELLSSTALITSNGADVQVTGVGGGTGVSDWNIGVYLHNGGSISAGGTGNITIHGTGGAADGATNNGFMQLTSSTTGSVSGAGTISITGIGGGTAASGSNKGVQIQNGNDVVATGNGSITINGTGGLGASGNNGVSIEQAGTAISAVDGDISITGVDGPGTSDVAFRILSTATLTTTGTGDISIAADSQTISGAISSAGGLVTLRQTTNGTLIGLGAADLAGTLGLTNAELNLITADTIAIGNASSGAVTISSVISPASYQTLDIQQGVTFASTGGFTSDVTSAAVFERIKANGAVSINTSAALTATAIGGFVPAAGDSFTLLDNTSASTTTGNFSGKPEGTLVAVGGVDKTITYVGGTGNDVVLIPANTAPTITSNGGGATASISIAENTTAVTTVVATDTDLPAQTITYSKSGPDAALFNIGSSTGVLTFATAPDFETGPGPFSVTVTATDDGTPNLSDSQVLTISVLDVNEGPPAGTDKTITLNEGATYTFVPADFGFTDPLSSPANNFKTLHITTLPSAGTLSVGGVPAVAGDTVTPSTAQAGAVLVERTNAVQSGNTPGFSSVFSSGDGMKIVAKSFNGYLRVSTDGGANWVTRNTIPGFLLEVLALSRDGSKLIATNSLSGTTWLNMSSDNGQTWTQLTSAGGRDWRKAVISANGQRIAAAAANGYVHTSTDGGSTWTQQTGSGTSFEWTSLVASDDGMRLAAGRQNSVGVHQLLLTSTDGGVTWASQPNSGIRNWSELASSADGLKLITGSYNSVGRIFTSVDGGANWTERTTSSSLTWNAVASSADGLRLFALANQHLETSSDGGATWTVKSLSGAPNFISQSYSFAISSDGSRLAIADNFPMTGSIWTSVGAGSTTPVLTYTAPSVNANASPLTSFTFQVEDDGSTANGGQVLDLSPNTIAINVLNLNGAPTDIALTSATIAENNPANATVGTLSTTDADVGDTHTYTLVAGTGDTDNGAFNISGNALRLTGSADYETRSSYSVRVRTTDTGGLFFEKAFTITVLNLVENVTIGFHTVSGIVGSYYNGGTDAAGNSGPNVGVVFPNSTAGGGKIGETALANVPAGFTGGFSCNYIGVSVGFGLSVWSGPNATGTALASKSYDVNGDGTAFITFSGTAQSVSLGKYSGSPGYDNFTFGSTTVGTPVAEPPGVTTTAATSVGATSATLNATVNPGGAATTAQFEYGTTVSYGSTAAVTLSPNNGTTGQTVSVNLTGLAQGTTYFFRITGTNSVGSRNGSGLSFATPVTDYVFTGTGNWSSSANWQGGFVPPATLPSGKTITINGTGACTLDVVQTLASGSSMTINAGKTLSGGIPGGTNLTVNSGATLTVAATGVLSQGRIVNSGTIDLFGTYGIYFFTNNSGAVLNVKSGGTYNNSAGAQSFAAGGTVNNDGTMNFGTGSNAGTLNNNTGGVITDTAGGAQLTNSGTINNAGSFVSRNCTTSGSFNNLATGSFTFGGSALFNVQSGGTFTNDGILNVASSNSFTVSSGGTLTNNANIKGGGTMVNNGTWTNSSTSTITPGSLVGKLTVTGPLDMGSTTYTAEINGTVQGTGYDWLAVSGAATLTNASLVVNWGSFTPTAGQTYTVMTFASRTGTFANVTIPPVSGLVFSTNYTSTAVTISAALPNTAPAVAATNGTVTVSEGSAAANTGTFSDAEGNATVTLTASLGTVTPNNGAGTWSWSYTPADGPATPTITITATDNGTPQLVTTTTFALTVNNVAPTATFAASSSPVNEGTASPPTVSFTSPVDPGTADVSAGLKYSYDFNNDGTFDNGDGTYAGSSASASVAVPASYFVIPAPPQLVVRGRIIDKDGGFTDYTATIAINHAPSAINGPILISEDFDYGAVSGSLNGANGGTGFSGAWSGGNYTATGLSFNTVPSVGGAMPSSIANRLLSATMQAAGPVRGSFLFRRGTGAGSVNMLGLGGSNNQTDNLGLLVSNDNLNGNAVPQVHAKGGSFGYLTAGPITENTTFMYVFSHANNTITAWILNEAQYNNFIGNGLAPADLNAASIGTGATNVIGRNSSTGPSVGNFNNLFAYAFGGAGWTFDCIRISAMPVTAALTVAENAAVNTTVGSLAATDADVGDSFTFALVTGTGDTDNASFNISGSALRTSTPLDFEAGATRSIRVRATDQGGLTYEQALTVNVSNVNEAPTALALSSNSTPENVAANTTIGTFTTTDQDAGNTFTYSLVAGAGSADNSAFNISANALRITNSPDYEVKNTYAIRVRTTDQGGLFFEQPFTISITDVNEGPTSLSLSNASIAENVAANTTIGTLSSVGGNVADTFTYSLTGIGNDNADFNISGTALRTTSALDFEAKSSYTVHVRTTDQNGLFLEQDFTITVTNKNELPSFALSGTNPRFPYLTSGAQSTSAIATSISDGDSTVVQSLTFNVSNNNAALFSSAPAINSSTGDLSYTLSGTSGSATVSVTLTDDNSINGDAALTTATQTFTITVDPAPDYTVVTSSGVMTVTDVSGNGDTLAISEPVAGSIKFDATGRTFSVNGALNTTGDSGNITLAGLTSIVVDAAAGADVINVGAFTNAFPSLTINGGTGDDTVNLNGDITFASNASLDLDLQNDNVTPGTDIVNVATTANLITSGTGTITVKVSKNVAMAAGSSFETVNGNLIVEANIAGTAVGNFSGVQLTSASLKSSGSGNIAVNAQGGDDASTGLHRGIRMVTAATINSTGTGGITLIGTGGSGAGGNQGILLSGASVEVTSASGPIQFTGTGGNGTAGFNEGVAVSSGAKVIATNAAPITISGTGGTGTQAIRGVEISFADTQITTVNGDVLITGIGGTTATADQANGILLAIGATISSSGTGKITLDGTGGAGTDYAHGLWVNGTGTLVTSVTGDITLTGRALATTTGSLSYGAFVEAGAQVTSTGTGASAAKITMNGTGGGGAVDNTGAFVGGALGAISSVDGNVKITGTAGSGGLANGSYAASIGYPGNPAGSASITLSGTAALELIGDTVRIDSTAASITSGTGSVTIRPKTAGQLIDLGGADSATALGLTDAELDKISAGTLNIGDANSGALTVSAAITRSAATVLNLASGANIDLTTGSLNSAGGNVTLNPGSNVFASNSGVDVTTGAASTLTIPSGDALKIVINGTTADSGYTQLNVAGKIDLTGATLALSGTQVPALDQVFTIVNNDSNDLITGTFSGLPEGALIPAFLGSSLYATVSYVGGDGNDVTLTIARPEIRITESLTDLVDGTATVDFGNVDNLVTSAPKTFTISNVGGNVLTLGALSIDGLNAANYLANTSGMSTTVLPAASTSFTVTVTPSTIGLRTAALHLVNDDTNETPFDINLSATSQAAFALVANKNSSTPPGVEVGTTYHTFYDAYINNSRRVIYSAQMGTIGTVPVEIDQGTWTQGSDGSLVLFMRAGTDLGNGQTVSRTFNFPRLADSGAGLLQTTVLGTGPLNVVQWMDDGISAITLFANRTTEYAAVPEFSAFTGFTYTSQNQSTGEGFFPANLVQGGAGVNAVTSANDSGVWKVAPDGTVTAAAREGDAMPATVGVGLLQGAVKRVVTSSSGYGIYAAQVSGAGVTSLNTEVIMTRDFNSAAAPTFLARTDSQAPGLSVGCKFYNFIGETVNAAGKGLIWTQLTGTGVTGPNARALFSDRSGSLALVARYDDDWSSAYGAGIKLSAVSAYWLLNDNSVVLVGTLKGTGVTTANDGIVARIALNGTITSIAREGQALGVAGNATISVIQRVDVSSAGKAAILCSLVTASGSPATTASTNQALVTTDVTTPATKTLMTRKGATIGSATVGSITLSSQTVAGNTGATAGMSRVINDSGDTCAIVTFTNGDEGVFVGP